MRRPQNDAELATKLPAIQLPTNTDPISGGKWALGPTGVVVKQEAGWTYGVLANHVWSLGGPGAQDISDADSPSSGAHGFGVRLTVTLLFAE